MSRIRTRTIILSALVAALALGTIAYALNQVIKDAPTGLFQVAVEEQADIAVATYGMAADAGPSATWCEAPDLSAGVVRCVVDVMNRSQTKQVAVTLALADVDTADGLGLADVLGISVYQRNGADSASRNNCRSGALGTFTLVQSGTLAALAAGSALDLGTLDVTGTSPYQRTLCLVIDLGGEVLLGPLGSVAQTSATLRFTGTAP